MNPKPVPTAGVDAFTRFVESERAGGVILIACTAASLAIANSPWGGAWISFWQRDAAGLTLGHWVNDALMAVFFLLVGLELEREVYVGELSDIRSAFLPIAAAAGGIVAPAAIHFALNADTPGQAGAAIPMATDIAFALAALALLGNRVPLSLKVFLTALAVIDDLGAILVIGAAYTSNLSLAWLAAALAALAALVVLNRLRVEIMAVYLAGGALMWFFTLKSGVHATLAGVLLAFAIPFTATRREVSLSHALERRLHVPVAFAVLPLFALANTGVALAPGWHVRLFEPNALGVLAGLVLGKPLGIIGASLFAVAIGLCRLPPDLGWRHIAGAGMLGGIGFTMSIFIANLAFPANATLVDASKMAILVASATSAAAGVAWLAFCLRSRSRAP